VFAAAHEYAPIAVSAAHLDSAAQRRSEIDAMTSPASYANRPPLVPMAALPPVRRALEGRDGSVWLELEDNLTGHLWLLLDERGLEVGRVTLPENVNLKAADRTRLWALERDSDDLEAIVVYRLQAAP
jgi:hypothetical protein